MVTNNILECGEKKQKGFFGQNDRDHDAAVLLRRSPGNNWSCLTQLRSTRWREGRHSRVTQSAICTAETATHTSYKSKKSKGYVPGWQELGERGSGAPRNVRVFYERKDSRHTLFCGNLGAFLKAFLELSTKVILLSESFQ